MKKSFLLIALIISCIGLGKAQNCWTLDTRTIEKCERVEAVAWNYVMSIVNENYGLMEQFMASEYLIKMRNELQQAGLTYEQAYQPKRIHDFSDMRPLLKRGWHLVITDVRNQTVFYNNEEVTGVSVSFNCANANNVLYPADGMYEHDSDGRVVLLSLYGVWKVAECH